MPKSSKARRPKKTVKPAKEQAKKLNTAKPKAKTQKAKAKAAKLKANAGKPGAKASNRSSASIIKRTPSKSSSNPSRIALKKLATKKPTKVAVKKLTLKKRTSSKIQPKGKKISQERAIVRAKTKTGPKIATKTRTGATTVGATGNLKNRATKKGTQPKKNNFIMSTESKNNQKEVSPGGGLVLPATKSAPAMNLRADDAAILATAKERYGRRDLEAFKKLLLEQLTDAKEEFEILSQNILDTSGEFEADNQNYAMHTAEQGTDAIEREKTFLHAQRTSDYIKKLEEALERIDRGIYGICVICGGLIEKERLQAVPITQKHVDCKNRTQTRKPSGSSGFRDHEEQPPVNVE